jgi:hypothetical protein
MESLESLLNLLSKPEPNKKEEISKFTNLINTFKYEQDSIDKKYIDIFNDIIEKRLKLILEPDPDYMYLWKVLQTIRVLSRNKIIQKEMYKESHITMYKLCFERLINVTSKWKIIESMITELMTIIQRYFYYKLEQNEDIQEKYINMIIDSDIIDNIILMYSSENENTVKLLESIFNKESYSILNREMVIQKFIDPKNILTLLTFLENKIGYSRPSSSASNISSISSINTNINTMSMNNKNNIGAFAILDLFIFLIKNEEKFTNGFIELEGYKILFELIQSNYDNEKAKLNAKKALFIIQYLSKKLDNKKFKDIKSFIEFFEYLLENKTNEEDVYIIEMSIRSFYFFASNFELSVITNSKWSKLLFRFLLVLSLKIKDLKDAEEQKKLITTQCYIIRVLRQIYSFERNRNIFTQMIPQNIFKTFDSIPLGWELGTEHNFEESTNALSIDEIETILQKVNRILFSDTGDGGVIGDYKILEMIGKGGFGSVYKVENIKEKTQFAMKMVKLEPEQIKYFKEHKSEMYKAINEIRIWKKFNHPNIIFYDNSFVIKENCYIIMELVEGLSLGEYISYLKDNNRKMEKELVIKIILQIVSGLRYMHKKANVIFRDLNPNNIMLDYSYNVKLIDFGLTVEEGKTKKVSTILNQSVQFVFEGSVMYSSPEVMKNEIISYESDIWALGCIIYEMIKLTPPFTGDNSLTVANNVCEGTYVKLKENDFENKEIIKLVENCLVVDMQKRYNIDNVCQLLGPFLFDYFSEIKDI